MAWRYGLGLEALRGAVFGTILLGIAMTDARAYIIPDEFTLGGLVIGLLFAPGRGLPARSAPRCSARRSGSGCSGWSRSAGTWSSSRRRWAAATSR